ncbi:nuclear transport factor 2 family protein [Myxococcus fulvus]|uniref:nuclear transport factor 2 family protein n=1 Tax=Myxococcus fulvus TaxID=33 RepID=UPI0020C044B0|nr:nuclear transport factor 2 family protein [Myxococcus fulvus]MCK8499204.1 nuclear transport factor 2 family protein [Myxococcus fulvus]
MMTEEDILAAEEALRQAMLASDVDMLDQLLSEDLVFVNHLGQVFNKDADLEGHGSGALRLTRLELGPPVIRFLSAGAVVVVRASVAGQSAGAGFAAQLRYTRVWQWVDERPQVVAGQCTVIVDASS